ncbi:GIY-YIG nuclease family protein [Marinoscillum pacificum]|uniref:GIY-YIG nuclease family protein n=1 Tax=Marinoscillum pacificum TaxID=392723 RepID=UPI0021574FD2|nr:GIY-YIG nuclease family protein [Marinoscillum pacificum]
MAVKSFNIEIEGYWREKNKGGITPQSGVYFVYECTYNQNLQNLAIHKLIYIGEAANVRKRIDNHEKKNDWEKHVRPGNELCYSTGPVGSIDRERVEAAYIFEHKPPENIEYKNSFPYDQTSVISSGKTAKINTNFTVYKTE